MREGIKEYSDWPTIPQLYVDGEFVGGCDIVRELEASGELASEARARTGPLKASAIGTARVVRGVPKADLREDRLVWRARWPNRESSMTAERRVVACLLLLMGAAPLLVALLPERVDVLTPPMLVVVAAAVATLVPSLRVLQVLGWSLGAGTMLLASYWQAPAQSVGMLALVPLGLVVLTDRPAVGLAGLVAGAVGLVGMLGTGELAGLRAGAGTQVVDRVGQLAVVGWILWQGSHAVSWTMLRRAARRQLTTASALERALERDLRLLAAIADVVAEPGLAGPVRGAGLGPDALGLAARIDARRVLVGWIEGPPLRTLTVGWALVAAARAGRIDPRALVRWIATQFDEVVPPAAVRWLGVWDWRAGVMIRSGAGSVELARCALTPSGPRAVAMTSTPDTAATLRALFGPDATQDPGDAVRRRATAWLGWLVLAAIAVVPVVVALPAAFAPVSGLALVAADAVARRLHADASARRHAADRELADRIDLHDDLSNGVAHLHGSLLPYRIALGDLRATAHRLRGEVLDGAFADMIVDARGRARIVAGEVAGRGIAARFVGLAAQVVARIRLGSGAVAPADLQAEVGRRLRELARALRFGVRLRLGVVTLDSDGTCGGFGTLRRFVRVAGASPERASEPMSVAELVQVVGEACVDEDTRVYLTPAAAVPGPDDEAPALPPAEATDRVVELVQRGRWHPRVASLASLFSLVFDGVTAPAHGTIIELAWSRAEDEHQDADDGEADEGQSESPPPPALAAV